MGKENLCTDGHFRKEHWEKLQPPSSPMRTIGKVDGLMFENSDDPDPGGYDGQCGRALFREDGTCYLVRIYNDMSVASWGLKSADCTIDVAEGTYEEQEEVLLICSWKHHVQSETHEGRTPGAWQNMDDRASLRWNRIAVEAESFQLFRKIVIITPNEQGDLSVCTNVAGEQIAEIATDLTPDEKK